MALDAIAMKMLDAVSPFSSVLSLGCPDIPGVADPREWFRSRGAEAFDVIDVVAHRGYEWIVDLNVSVRVTRSYALVINPGTLEHVFNIGVAWESTWRAVQQKGYVLHVAPASMLNHGYWNICPLALRDWCEINGGHVIAERFGINGTAQEVDVRPIEVNRSGRGMVPPECVYYALARKIEEMPTRWPRQGLYR